MRVFGHLALVGCLTVGVLAQGTQQAPAGAKTAEAVLADARKALGGDKLTTVKNFVATGRTKQVRGNNLVPIEFEIACELPDKYMRKDEVPAQESDPTTSGFNGDGLVQIPAPVAPPPMPAGRATPPPAGPPPAGAATPPPGATARGGAAPGAPAAPAMTPEQMMAAQRKSRVTALKQDFVRLTLGLFAQSFSSYPLTFTYAGVAEAPQGKADALDVTGDGNFKARFFVDSTTHLPLMVSWNQPPTQVIVTVPGQPPPATVPPGAVVVEGPAAPAADAAKDVKDKYTKDVADLRKATQAKPVEYRVYYAEYKDANGLMWPFRLRRAIGADTTEETTFDGFKINTKIDPKKFEVVK